MFITLQQIKDQQVYYDTLKKVRRGELPQETLEEDWFLSLKDKVLDCENC